MASTASNAALVPPPAGDIGHIVYASRPKLIELCDERHLTAPDPRNMPHLKAELALYELLKMPEAVAREVVPRAREKIFTLFSPQTDNVELRRIAAEEGF